MADENYWRIDGVPISKEPQEEIRTFETLELTVQVPVKIVREILRDVRDNAGNVEYLPRSDGGFETVDQSDGNNNHKLQPPANRQDVRRQLEWVAAAEYDEEMLDTTGEKFEVELVFAPEESKRKYSGHEDDIVEADDWLFELDAGDVATREVNSEIYESVNSGAEQLELELTLNGQQVRKVEESFRRLNGARVREQVDGTPIVEDTSLGKVNTFYLSLPPDGEKAIDSGWYVCMDWETEHLGGDGYQTTLEAALISDPSHFDYDPTFVELSSEVDYGKFEPKETDY